jgi:hypothetical protein
MGWFSSPDKRKQVANKEAAARKKRLAQETKLQKKLRETEMKRKTLERKNRELAEKKRQREIAKKKGLDRRNTKDKRSRW